jgi:hypothetical protein
LFDKGIIEGSASTCHHQVLMASVSNKDLPCKKFQKTSLEDWEGVNMITLL